MPIVLSGKEEDGSPYHLIHCPACGMAHKFDKRWTYNGNPEKPTFRASMLVKWYRMDDFKSVTDGTAKLGPDGRYPGKDIICHSFVTDGRIQYLNDCTHEMAGKTVDLEEV